MGVSDEALGVIPGRTAPSADLGGKSSRFPCASNLGERMLTYIFFTGSSKYSNENFED